MFLREYVSQVPTDEYRDVLLIPPHCRRNHDIGCDEEIHTNIHKTYNLRINCSIRFLVYRTAAV